MSDSEKDAWYNVFSGGAAAAPGAVAAAPAPASDPGLLEEVEEGVKSGVRVIAKAAPAVRAGLSAAALAPIAVGAAVGAAIMTWSTSTAPPWMDEMNPENGKPYASEDEYKNVKERQRRRQRGEDAVPPPAHDAPPDDDPDYKPPPPTCQSLFPQIQTCGAGAASRGWGSMDEAARAQPEYGRIARKNVSTMSDYQGLPGGDNSHVTYYDGSDGKLFTLIKTPCCQESAAGPVLLWRWVTA